MARFDKLSTSSTLKSNPVVKVAGFLFLSFFFVFRLHFLYHSAFLFIHFTFLISNFCRLIAILYRVSEHYIANLWIKYVWTLAFAGWKHSPLLPLSLCLCVPIMVEVYILLSLLKSQQNWTHLYTIRNGIRDVYITWLNRSRRLILFSSVMCVCARVCVISLSLYLCVYRFNSMCSIHYAFFVYVLLALFIFSSFLFISFSLAFSQNLI